MDAVLFYFTDIPAGGEQFIERDFHIEGVGRLDIERQVAVVENHFLLHGVTQWYRDGKRAIGSKRYGNRGVLPGEEIGMFDFPLG